MRRPFSPAVSLRMVDQVGKWSDDRTEMPDEDRAPSSRPPGEKPATTCVKLEPDLSHCIETVAREEFGRGMRLLLAGERAPGLAERTELLRQFLETADFSELRRISEPLLAGGRKVTFIVYDDNGTPRYRLDVY